MKSSLLETIERYRRLLTQGPNDDGVRATLKELLAEAEAAVTAIGDGIADEDPEVA